MTPVSTPILADTNIWTRHLRSQNPQLTAFLRNGRVMMHPFIVAELSLVSWPDRMTVLAILEDLPSAPVATMEEVRELIDLRSLYDKGIGLVDAYLLSSVIISPLPIELWTADASLASAAKSLGVLSSFAMPRTQ